MSLLPSLCPWRESADVPAWPDIRPINAFCLPQSLFIPHIDRILTALGVPVEGRTSMITSWLPSLMRHKNIVSLRKHVTSASLQALTP